MALQVIGAGFGRTGTLSLKGALEQLGLGPCHHMAEVLADPAQLPHWQAAVHGGRVDWDAVLAGYRATVDWPSAFFWRELAAAYPEAKVILSTRDPEGWYDSFEKTILRVIDKADDVADPHVRETLRMGRAIVRDRVFGAARHDRAQAIAILREHEEHVKATVPPARLLVLDVRQGWAPLCAFLELEVPAGPFPRLNDAEQFKALVGE